MNGYLKFYILQGMLSDRYISEIKDAGKGRAFVIVYESEIYKRMAELLSEEISASTRCLLLRSSEITDFNWREASAELQNFLLQKSLRQASFVAFAAASSLVMHMALCDLKQVRSLTLIDACTRPHPTLAQRFIDRVESFLPLGLPLRSKDKGFDAKAFLQRLRCPILVLVSSNAGLYARSQAEIFKKGLPTAWSLELGSANQSQELKELILDFQKVPAKCPQKNANGGNF